MTGKYMINGVQLNPYVSGQVSARVTGPDGVELRVSVPIGFENAGWRYVSHIGVFEFGITGMREALIMEYIRERCIALSDQETAGLNAIAGIVEYE